MKASKLIEILAQDIARHGDSELRFTVGDHYSRYGEEAELNIDTTGCVWTGIVHNVDMKWTTLQLDLKTYDGKYPKITFRKP